MNIESVLWGSLGAGLVFICGLLITWIWVFPWAATRWINKASIPGSKQSIMVRNLSAAVMENAISFIPEIVKKNKQGQYVIPEELKVLIEAMEYLATKQIQLSLNKAFGGVKKALSNVGDIEGMDISNLDLSQLNIDPEMLTSALVRKLRVKSS